MQVHISVYVFQPSDEGPMDAEAGEDETSPYCEWQLPAKCFCGLWESLLYGQVRKLPKATAAFCFMHALKGWPYIIDFEYIPPS